MRDLPRARVTMAALAAALSAFWVPAAQAGEVMNRIKASGTIVIGHRESSIPFSYLSPDRKPIGYAIDLCGKLADVVAKELAIKSLKVQYKLVTATDRIESIEQNKADLVCESITDRPDRREKVAFLLPHYLTGARYLVRADSPIADLRDFEGKRIASTVATGSLKAIRSANDDKQLRATIVEVPEHLKGVEAVESGAVDGFVMDEVLIQGLMSTRADPSKLKIVGKYLTVEPLAVSLSKRDEDLKRLLNDEMRRLIRTREINALHDRWFLQPIPPTGKALGIQMPYLLRDFWRYPGEWVSQ